MVSKRKELILMILMGLGLHLALRLIQALPWASTF